MNLAFPALLLIVYVLPGIAFFYGLRVSSSRSTGSPAPDFTSLVAFGVILALPLHWLWVSLAALLPLGAPPNLADALFLVADKNGDETRRIIANIADNAGSVTLYFTTIIYFAFPLGKVVGTTVPGLINFLFRTSRWDGLLKARSEYAIYGSIVVERSNTAYIYVGICIDQIIDEKGMIKGIWLGTPRRRPFTGDIPDNPKAEVFYPIDADFLYISMEKVQSCSFKRFKIEPFDAISKIAHELWLNRKSPSDDSVGQREDWERAKLLHQHRLKYSKGIRALRIFNYWRNKGEEKIKNQQV